MRLGLFHRFALVLLSLVTLATLCVGASGDGIACPVCGMSVDDTSPFTYAWKGHQTTYFCSSGCEKAFTSDPSDYLKGTAKDASTQAMPTAESPHVRRIGAFSAEDETCPVCGMAVPDAHHDRVSIKGNQEVLTCSPAHAEKVFSAPKDYKAGGAGKSPLPNPSKDPSGTGGTGDDDEPYCVSGSVMWPGFAWKNKVCTILLFESVRISSPGGLLVACILMIVLGAMVEAIHTFRKKVIVRNYNRAVIAEKYRSAKSSFGATSSATAMLLETPASTGGSGQGSCCSSSEKATGGSGNAAASAAGAPLSSPSKPCASAAVATACHTTSGSSVNGVSTVTYDVVEDGFGGGISRDIRTGGSPLAWRLANSALFATAIGVGYLLMLAAMSYNLSIFFSVIVGLGTGHAIFIEPSDKGDAETKEPCCG